MRALQRGLGEQDAVVGEDRDRVAPQVREAADQRLAVERLELVEFGAVDQARDHLAHVVGLAQVARHDAVELRGLVRGQGGLAAPEPGRRPVIEAADDLARHRERVRVVVGEVIDDAGGARVHVAAAERLGVDDLAGRRLHQRRPAEEDRALVAHDDRFVAHRGHVGAARGAGAHDHRDLRNAGRREPRLVVEDAAEVLAVREHLVLQRQEGAARVDEVDAGQAVLERDFLGAQVLLDRHRVVGAALDGRVVRDDQELAAVDAADARDEAGGRRVVAVHAAGRERRDLEEGAARVEQGFDAVARQQLAARDVLRARGFLAAARRRQRLAALQLGDERRHVRGVVAELRAAGVDARGDAGHGAVARSSSRPISMRRISLVPAPIS